MSTAFFEHFARFERSFQSTGDNLRVSLLDHGFLDVSRLVFRLADGEKDFSDTVSRPFIPVFFYVR